MELIIFRHGIAEDAAFEQADFDRALTARGIDRTTAAARGLARIIDPPQLILTSPKVRAAQTAAILGDVFDRVPQTLDCLADESPRTIWKQLRQRDEESIAIVGHEPTFSQLVALLQCGEALDQRVDLKKAGCAILRTDEPPSPGPGVATLTHLLPPKVLRELAG